MVFPSESGGGYETLLFVSGWTRRGRWRRSSGISIVPQAYRCGEVGRRAVAAVRAQTDDDIRQ